MRRQNISTVVAALFLLFLLLFSLEMTEAFFFRRPDANDLYGLLGVKRDATKSEIKKAFRKITREHHPDLQETPEAKEAAKEHMVKVLRAYRILSDDIERQNYDSSGKHSDEGFNAGDFTAEEIFKRFQQQSLIVSKSPQLESLGALQRILNFRGNRVFLLQVYDDTCDSCHAFKGAWETFFGLSLVQGGAVEMARIDARATMGPPLLRALNIKYKGEVQVFAVVDGEVWVMPSLQKVLRVRNGASDAFSALVDFVMGFVHDKLTELNSLTAENGAQDILQWLREDRGASGAVRVLVPPTSKKWIGLTLALVHDDVVLIREVPRQALLDVAEGYCGQSLEVRDRDGEIVPEPEFILVSSKQLPNVTGAAFMPAQESEEQRSCEGIHIGVSVTLTYNKAVAFLKESMPPRHAGMGNVTYVTSMSLYDICRRHCLLWLRNSCREAPSDTWKNSLQEDYKPFAVGYMCLDAESELRAALPAMDDDALVAVVDGDENTLHFLPTSLEPRHIAEALSRLLAGDGGGTHSLPLAAPLSRLLIARPLRLSQQQYWNLRFWNLYAAVYPFFSNVYPILIMFVLRKIFGG